VAVGSVALPILLKLGRAPALAAAITGILRSILLCLQALESPLLVAVAAGSVALPTLLKLAEVLTAQKQDFVIGEQLPVEVDLGKVRKTSTDTRTTLEVPRKLAFLSLGSWFAAAEAGLCDQGAATSGGRTGQGEDAIYEGSSILNSMIVLQDLDGAEARPGNLHVEVELGKVRNRLAVSIPATVLSLFWHAYLAHPLRRRSQAVKSVDVAVCTVTSCFVSTPRLQCPPACNRGQTRS